MNELRDGTMDTPMSFTNRVFSQFCFAGIHPYTMNFARIAAVDYKPSTSGERIINHCLTNLPVYVAADDDLQLGWDENYIMRNLALHQFEYQHILLMSAMAECLPETYVAAVLSNLSVKHEEGDRFQPTIRSWAGLVRSISGILTTSDFALMVDQRMRLDPYRVTSGHSTSCTNSLVPPAQFARALEALMKLSSTGKGDLTLVGGNFLGWIAAFAELFLGVNVHISARDGHELYSTKTGSEASVRLVFMDDPEATPPATIASQPSNALVLTVMCPPDAHENTVPRIPFTGRVGWEGLLPKVFENCFNKIAHSESKCFVQSVGGVARMFTLMAEDPNTPEELVSKENRLNASSWGVGLIQTLCNWFPELRHLQGRLERLQSLDKTAAGWKCNEGAIGFIRICGCTICGGIPYTDAGGNLIEQPEDKGQLPQSFCLLAIMETILNLALAMSRITVVPSVYPSRAGILCVYQRQVRKLLHAKTLTRDSTGRSRLKALFLNDWNATYSRRLQTAAAIFSGSWPQGDLPENLCALKHEGICAYVMDIQYGEKSSRHQRDKDVIRVLPGHIAFKQRVFTRATTGPPKGISDDDYSWEEASLDHMVSKKLYFKWT